MDNPVETLEPNAEVPAEDSIIEAVSDDHNEDSTTPEQEAEAEFEDLDVGDEKLSLPKHLAEKLKAERLMHADYTKKTMSLAEERKAAEAERETIKAEREAVEAERQLARSNLRLAAQREHLAATYQQLEAINLFELNQQDPVKAQEVLIQKQQVANALSQVHGQLTHQEQQAKETEQQNYAKSAEKAASYLTKAIKGWEPNNDVDKQITEYAASLGLKGPNVAKAIINQPEFGVVLDKARQFDEMMKAKAIPKSKPTPQQVPPVRITASQGTATKDPSKMTDAEFAAWRRAQIKRRA